MKKLYLIMLLAPLALLGGCSNDDDADIKRSDLVGTWDCYKSYDEEYDEWDYDYSGDFMLEFRENGQGILYEETQPEEFLYKVKGSTLYIYAGDEYDGVEVEHCRIAKLTASELVLVFGSEKDYFRRIN